MKHIKLITLMTEIGPFNYHNIQMKEKMEMKIKFICLNFKMYQKLLLTAGVATSAFDRYISDIGDT